MNIHVGRLLAGSAIPALLVAIASPAFAQTADQAPAAVAAADQTQGTEEIVVTGTVFRRTDT